MAPRKSQKTRGATRARCRNQKAKEQLSRPSRGRRPSSRSGPPVCWWISGGGGSPVLDDDGDDGDEFGGHLDTEDDEKELEPSSTPWIGARSTAYASGKKRASVHSKETRARVGLP